MDTDKQALTVPEAEPSHDDEVAARRRALGIEMVGVMDSRRIAMRIDGLYVILGLLPDYSLPDLEGGKREWWLIRLCNRIRGRA